MGGWVSSPPVRTSRHFQSNCQVKSEIVTQKPEVEPVFIGPLGVCECLHVEIVIRWSEALSILTPLIKTTDEVQILFVRNQ